MANSKEGRNLNSLVFLSTAAMIAGSATYFYVNENVIAPQLVCMVLGFLLQRYFLHKIMFLPESEPNRQTLLYKNSNFFKVDVILLGIGLLCCFVEPCYDISLGEFYILGTWCLYGVTLSGTVVLLILIDFYFKRRIDNDKKIANGAISEQTKSAARVLFVFMGICIMVAGGFAFNNGVETDMHGYPLVFSYVALSVAALGLLLVHCAIMLNWTKPPIKSKDTVKMRCLLFTVYDLLLMVIGVYLMLSYSPDFGLVTDRSGWNQFGQVLCGYGLVASLATVIIFKKHIQNNPKFPDTRIEEEESKSIMFWSIVLGLAFIVAAMNLFFNGPCGVRSEFRQTCLIAPGMLVMAALILRVTVLNHTAAHPRKSILEITKQCKFLILCDIIVTGVGIAIFLSCNGKGGDKWVENANSTVSPGGTYVQVIHEALYFSPVMFIEAPIGILITLYWSNRFITKNINTWFGEKNQVVNITIASGSAANNATAATANNATNNTPATRNVARVSTSDPSIPSSVRNPTAPERRASVIGRSSGPDSPQPQSGALPTKSGDVPPQPGAIPPQPGALPPQPGPFPTQPGALPPQPGPFPTQLGAIPPQPGPFPPQPGAIPPQPGASHPPPSFNPHYASHFIPGPSGTLPAPELPLNPLHPHSTGFPQPHGYIPPAPPGTSYAVPPAYVYTIGETTNRAAEMSASNDDMPPPAYDTLFPRQNAEPNV